VSGATGTEGEISALLVRWAEAVRDRDIRFLERLLAPEFTLTTGRMPNPVRGRDEYLEITESRYQVSEFEFESIKVLDYGDAAVARSRYRQRGSMDGADRSQLFLMTDVFAKVDGRWLAVTRHLSPM
jgi:ketosteroid isomerase-like protein